MVIVLRRLRRPVYYQKVLEDWVWHVVLPSLAYLTLMVAHVALRQGRLWALYAIGAVALVLLLIGIHNAWDTVTFLVASQQQES
jgi:hypothetical protein